MNRNEARALYVAVLALAMSMLLLEVLAFRISNCVLGPRFAAFVAFWNAGAAGLGAAFLTRIPSDASVPQLARRAAHLSAIAGATTLVGTVGFSWVSDRVTRAAEDIGALDAAIATSAWLLPAFFGGGALALVVRIGSKQLGRMGWLEALGAAGTCLLLNGLLTIGAPRAALATGLPFAAAALMLGHLAREARPNWATLVTLPLGVTVLLLGDIGAPWLRIDSGPHAAIHDRLWTVQGLVAVRNPERGPASLTVDKSYEIFLPQDHQDAERPRFAVQDLVYAVNEKAQGPALVIGSAGGRELAIALKRGHEPLDAVALQGVLVNAVLGEGYAEKTGYILADDRLHVAIGDGRTLPTAQYQRIMVLGESRPVQAGPRLLMQHDRLFTLEAIRGYLERLRPDGTLLLQVPRAMLPNLLATLHASLSDAAAARLMACSTRLDWAAVVVHTKPLAESEQRELAQRCKGNGMVVEYPASGELSSGHIARDGRPFLESDARGVGAAFAALVPISPKSKEAKDAKDAKEPPPAQGMVAGAASLVLAAALALVTLWPRPRRVPHRPLPRTVELSLAPFGAGLALCVFALVDELLTSLGNPAFAWSLLIPMSLVGIAAGRLWIDVADTPRLARPALLASCAWLLLVAFAAPPLIDAASARVSLALSVPLLFVTAAVLGAPLYAILRMLGDDRRDDIGRFIGIHQLGWALGGSLSILLAHEIGLPRILLAGLAMFLAGSALVWPTLKKSEARAPVLRSAG